MCVKKDIKTDGTLSDHSDMEELSSLGLGSLLEECPSLSLDVGNQFDFDELLGFLEPPDENFSEKLAEGDVGEEQEEEGMEEEQEEGMEEQEEGMKEQEEGMDEQEVVMDEQEEGMDEQEGMEEHEEGMEEHEEGMEEQEEKDDEMPTKSEGGEMTTPDSHIIDIEPQPDILKDDVQPEPQSHETPKHCRQEDTGGDSQSDEPSEEEGRRIIQTEGEEEMDSLLDVTGDVDQEHSWAPTIESTPRSDTTAAYEWDIASQLATESADARKETMEFIATEVQGEVFESALRFRGNTRSPVLVIRRKSLKKKLEEENTPIESPDSNMYDTIKNRKRSCVVLQETEEQDNVKPKSMKRQKRKTGRKGPKSKKATPVTDRARNAGLLPKFKS